MSKDLNCESVTDLCPCLLYGLVHASAKSGANAGLSTRRAEDVTVWGKSWDTARNGRLRGGRLGGEGNEGIMLRKWRSAPDDILLHRLDAVHDIYLAIWT